MIEDRQIVIEGIKSLERQGIREFSSKQVRENFPTPYKDVPISTSWINECINRYGYKWDKIRKLWVYYKPTSIDQSRIRKKLDLLENKIGEIQTALLNDDYCNKCLKKVTCKHYHWASTGLLKLIARTDICKAHKALIKEVAELGRIVNEQ